MTRLEEIKERLAIYRSDGLHMTTWKTEDVATLVEAVEKLWLALGHENWECTHPRCGHGYTCSDCLWYQAAREWMYERDLAARKES